MRAIDADVLEPDADYDDGEFWAVSMTQIENAPTIEPEIIRCRDCKYRGGLSGFYCDNMERAVGVDSFCSWAERRTDERSD